MSAAAAKSGAGRALPEIDHAESPLAWLRSRRDKQGGALIGDAAFEAGERFRRDFTVGGMMARTTMNWEALITGGERRSGGAGTALVIGETASAAQERVRGALAAVGPEFAGVLIDVCCHLKGLTDVERDRQWPSRSGKVVLRLALAALARHYGLGDAAEGAPAGRMRAWGAPDYRPKL